MKTFISLSKPECYFPQKQHFSASVWSRQESCFSTLQQKQCNKCCIWWVPIQVGKQSEILWKRAATCWCDQSPLQFIHLQQIAAFCAGSEAWQKLLLLARVVEHWFATIPIPLWMIGYKHDLTQRLPGNRTHWMFPRKRWLSTSSCSAPKSLTKPKIAFLFLIGNTCKSRVQLQSWQIHRFCVYISVCWSFSHKTTLP